MPIKEEVIKNLLREISKAISFLHSRNIMHCGIKPQNILIDAGSKVKLGDFGIFHIFLHINPHKTRPGIPYYESPELCKVNSYNKSVDIWALGCILYELCSLEVL